MSDASIWLKLREKGFSEKATAAIMGNMEAESNCIPYRLQGDFSKGLTKSLEYTSQVDRGIISRDQFVYDGPNGGGYGLCQWTYPSRKDGLYFFAKKRGTSIGDEQTAVDWFCEELHQSEFKRTLDALNSDGSIRDMVKVMLWNFENPDDKSEDVLNQRTKFAQEKYNKYAGNLNPEHSPTPTPTPTPPHETETCRPEVRNLRKGDTGRDVGMAQWALVDMEFDLGKYGKNKDGVDGDFGEKTEIAVNSLKESIGLDADGVIDDDVWQILFQ